MAVAAAGCTTQQTTTPTATATPLPMTKTITDSVGRSVTIPYTITRMSNPYYGYQFVLYMLGVGDTNVASYSSFNTNPTILSFDPRAANMSGAWSGDSVNMEQLLAVQPQVIFANPPSQDNRVYTVLNASIPVVEVDYSSVDGFIKAVSIAGDVFGGNAQETANKYVSYVNDEYANITSRVANIPSSQRQVFLQTTYYEGTGWQVYGDDDYDAAVLTKCGGINAYTVNGTPVLTEEQALVYAQNATIIFTNDASTMYKIKNDSAWQNVPAVKTNQIHVFPIGVIRWFAPGPEYGGLLPNWAAKSMYPDKFQDVDLASQMKYFYPTFMHYNISDQEVNAFMDNINSNIWQALTLNPVEVIPQ